MNNMLNTHHTIKINHITNYNSITIVQSDCHFFNKQ